MFKKLLNRPWGLFLLGFVLAGILAAVIFPEFMVLRHMEFIRGTFYADYWGSFTLTNFFYQGGMQLWDVYDQIPMAYYYLTLGVGKFCNCLVALTYILLYPLNTFHAELFEETFSAMFFLGNIFLKFAGSYLLFRKFSSSRAVAVLGGIYYAVLLSAFPFITGGLSYGSYVPLLVYLTLNVFEYFRLKDILLWLVFFCILLSDQTTHALYLYQGIHFMVLACLIWAISRRKTMANPLRDWRKGTNLRAIVLSAAVCLLLVVPVIYLLKGQMGDLDFGPNTMSTKLQPWNWHSYFTRHMEFGSPGLFLVTLIDYSRNLCWTCVGWAVVFFALFGLAMSRDSRKYILLTAYTFIWMINQPRDSFPFGLLAHTLNVLTNPFSFSVRLFGEVHVYFIPVWLGAMAVIGIESFREHAKARFLMPRAKMRLVVFLSLLFLFLVFTLPQLAAKDRYYSIFQTVMALLILWFAFKKPRRRVPLAVLLGIFIGLDALAMVCHVRHNMLEPYRPRLHVIEGRPELGLVGVNQQNPSILPYRDYFDLFQYNDPDNAYLFSYSFQDVPGIFYRYSNLGRDLLPGDDLRPKPKAYAFWDADGGQMRSYLAADKRLIVSGDEGLRDAEGGTDAVYVRVLPPQPRRVDYFPFDVTNDYPPFLKDGLAYYQFPSPQVIPRYFASTFLTDDRDLVQLYTINTQGNARRLEPVQGEIVRPWTFDVNNVRTGYITAAFLPQDYPVGEKFVLAVAAPPTEGITKVWRWQFDNLGFDYAAPRDRWLVFHYPYDRKWVITVDGHKQKFYLANKSFIGLPVKKGAHHILIQYWPQTPLRGLLLLAAILSVVSLIGVICLSLQDKPTLQS